MYATHTQTVDSHSASKEQQRSMHVQHDIVATKVYVTKSYSQFKFDPFNRPIDNAKLVALKNAIENHNLLADNPILVTLDFTVLDGQHRLRAAELLDTPIFYYFASDATIEDVPEMNGVRSAWKAQDYLDSWCKRGVNDYIAFRDFCKRFDWMTLSTARELCYYGDNTGLKAAFMNGTFQCNNLVHAEKTALAVLDFRTTGFEYWRTAIFIRVVSNLISNADYDHKRMVHQLKRQSARLKPALTMEEYMKMLDGIYNYNRRGTPYVELRYLNTGNSKYRADMKSQRKQVK